MIVERAEWPSIRDKLGALFQASFGRPVEQGYLDWRYYDNGQGQLLLNVEMADSMVVASYSAFPVDLVLDGTTIPTALSMTTMTHPQWRGQGLFPKLAAELYAHARDSGVVAIWGFPNANSHAVFNAKLDWKDIYEVPTMALDLQAVDARRLALDELVQSDDEFALEYPTGSTDGILRVNKSRDYLAWRYLRNPENTYRNFVISRGGAVSSYVVAKTFGEGIDLVDIQPSTSEEARVLLSHVARLSHDAGMKHICCWAPCHHFVHPVLERLGFKNTAPVTYWGGRTLVDSVLPDDWLDYRMWYFQMGDSDVY